MISEQELMQKVDQVSAEYVGQLDDLYAAIGMLSMGRLYGWRVVRLVSSKRHWSVACRLFGDLKQILPERGELSHKSVGLSICDKAGNYWDIVAGNVSRDSLPIHERKMAS